MNPEDKEFTDAFAEFTSGVVPPAVPAEPAAIVDPVVPAEPAAIVDPVAPAEPAAIVDPVAPAEPAAIVEPVAPVVPVEPAAVKNPEVEALRAELEALRAAQPAPVVNTPVVEELPPAYTADEQVALTKYQEDWPDIAKGEALLRRAEYKELVAYIFGQVQEYYAPAIEFVQSRTGRDQYTDIVALVPDYDAVRDKALAWVGTQPAYLKEAYTRVANEGTPKDVADMIKRFKVETGYVSTPAPAPVAVAPVAIPAAAARAAAALAVVKTTRSEQSQGVDENDFEGAFKEYVAKEEQRVVRK